MLFPFLPLSRVARGTGFDENAFANFGENFGKNFGENPQSAENTSVPGKGVLLIYMHK